MKIKWLNMLLGELLEFDIRYLLSSIAIIPKDCQDEGMKNLAALEKLIIEKQNQSKSIEINEKLSWEYNDSIRLRANPSNIIKMKADKSTTLLLK